jgi:enoyl-[acyl-carrier protein] reductase III
MSTSDTPVALVTGSSRGIGRAIALALAGVGYDVAVHHRAAGAAAAKAAAVAAEVDTLGRRAIVVAADLAQAGAPRHLITEVLAGLGRLDVLVLNAARTAFKPIHTLLDRELRELVDTNLTGQVRCLKEAVPALIGTRGSVVFVSSLGSRRHLPSYPLGALKAAMEAVVRDTAAELAASGVRVNAVCPGLVRTDSWKTLRQVVDGLERIPETALVTPEEVADVVLFLCSPGARAISGQTVVADRGLGSRLWW